MSGTILTPDGGARLNQEDVTPGNGVAGKLVGDGANLLFFKNTDAATAFGTITVDTATASDPRVLKLAQNNLIFAFKNSASNLISFRTAVFGGADPTDYTLGTEAPVSAFVSGDEMKRIERVDDTRFVCFTTTGKMVACSVNFGTGIITVGTDISLTESVSAVQVDATTWGTFMVTGSNLRSRYVTLDSGTVLTEEGSFTNLFSVTATAGSEIHTGLVASNRAVMAFNESASSIDQLRTRLFDIFAGGGTPMAARGGIINTNYGHGFQPFVTGNNNNNESIVFKNKLDGDALYLNLTTTHQIYPLDQGYLHYQLDC